MPLLNQKLLITVSISSLCIFFAVCAFAQMEPTARSLHPYWQMVDEVAEQIDKRPPRPLGINKGLENPGLEYTFESFRHLRTIDLLRSAREGVEVARMESSLGKDPLEIEQQVLNNVTIALEYLPLLIKDQRDIWEILTIIQNQKEDPVFRKFLMEEVFGSAKPESLLSLTLPELLFSLERRKTKGVTGEVSAVAAGVIKDADEMFHETMLRLASHPNEMPDIQASAIKLYYTFLDTQYLKIFDALTEVTEARKNGASVDILSVKNGEIPLSRESRDALRRLTKHVEALAAGISGHVSEESVRDDTVKESAEAVFSQMQEKYVGMDEAKLALLKEGLVPETDNFPTAPPMEGLPDLIKDSLIPPEGKPLSPELFMTN